MNPPAPAPLALTDQQLATIMVSAVFNGHV
jgi:hypothetical protein